MSNSPTSWAEVDKKLIERLNSIKAHGGKVRVLSGTINSPSTLKLINEFVKSFSHGEHVVYDAISDGEITHAQELAYGTKVLPRYRFDKADVIVSIDGDFLGTWLSPVEFTKQFSKNRKLDSAQRKLSKLITFESVMSLTGTNADVRVAIRPQDGAAVALALAFELGHNLKVASIPSEAASVVSKYSPSDVATSIGFDVEIIKTTAKELWGARGKSLVVAGSPQSQSENSLSLQLAVNLLNSMLQNDGATVDYKNSPSLQSSSSFQALTKLIKDMNAGEVDALFIYKSNPIYSLPKELGFAEAAKKVKEVVVSFSDRVDESAIISDYVLPDNHTLESWGDAEPQKNVFSLIQPTIRPLYDTRSFTDSLLIYMKAKYHDFHEYVQTHWRETIYKEYGMITPFELFWESVLRDGVFDGAGKRGLRDLKSPTRAFKGSALAAHPPKKNTNKDYTLALYQKVSMGDGNKGNNAWLQELPDPVTRATWENYACVSPATAKRHHLDDGDVVHLKVDDHVVEVPALIQPGLHDNVVAIALGYGREHVGSVGNNIGQNMFYFAKNSSDGLVFSGAPTSMTKTGVNRALATTQEHHSMEGRPIVREAALEDYLRNPHAGNEEKEGLTTIWSGHEYKGYRWAMSIDLNSCTGCQACVIGCQSENNIPVVGKDGVYRGRIMHWIRVDRYYSGTPDNPTVVHQPMLCQHCENAPCETVCPVLATVHDDEGLNVQIYNRCVGTRYCANNCPYKVRRFNWFEYNYGGQTRYPINLSQNPEVTVRSRGVMEKCTFCVQRISEAKNAAKNMGTRVKDGDLKTACQQSCPADAITFGDINSSSSEVTRLAKDPRGYHVLDELNTRPSINYLTKIRNSGDV